MREPGELTLVAIGPLTNVALALALEPPARLCRARDRRDGRGLPRDTPASRAMPGEFNFWVDPDAAAIVLASGAPLTPGRSRRDPAGPARPCGRRAAPAYRPGLRGFAADCTDAVDRPSRAHHAPATTGTRAAAPCTTRWPSPWWPGPSWSRWRPAHVSRRTCTATAHAGCRRHRPARCGRSSGAELPDRRRRRRRRVPRATSSTASDGCRDADAPRSSSWARSTATMSAPCRPSPRPGETRLGSELQLWSGGKGATRPSQRPGGRRREGSASAWSAPWGTTPTVTPSCAAAPRGRRGRRRRRSPSGRAHRRGADHGRRRRREHHRGRTRRQRARRARDVAVAALERRRPDVVVAQGELPRSSWSPRRSACRGAGRPAGAQPRARADRSPSTCSRLCDPFVVNAGEARAVLGRGPRPCRTETLARELGAPCAVGRGHRRSRRRVGRRGIGRRARAGSARGRRGHHRRRRRVHRRDWRSVSRRGSSSTPRPAGARRWRRTPCSAQERRRLFPPEAMSISDNRRAALAAARTLP